MPARTSETTAPRRSPPTDAGLTWTDPVALNSNLGPDSGTDRFPEVAVDSLGNWVAVWHSEDTLGGTIGSDTDILFATSLDFGDAPAPYPTGRPDGARHKPLGPRLGVHRDAELSYQPNAEANGDDATGPGGQDDEDGVTFSDAIRPGTRPRVEVQTSGPGYLNAWIDFNADGDWDDLGEQIFDDRYLLQAGTHTLDFSVPDEFTTTPSFARFRFSTQAGLSPTGLANDGEVEDYKVQLRGPFIVDVEYDAPDQTPDGIAKDSQGHTTLRAAIQEANALEGDDVIMLSHPLAQHLALTLPGNTAATGDLDITDTTGSLTIVGLGAAQSLIDAAKQGETSLGDRIFDVYPDATLILEGITVTGGFTATGGGGILNHGTLELKNSTISGNRAVGDGGGIANSFLGVVTLTGSTISNNQADGFGGGVASDFGQLTVQTSTISSNRAAAGAGIHFLGALPSVSPPNNLTIASSTISGNVAETENTDLGARGGGVRFLGGRAWVLHSTITGNVARNQADQDGRTFSYGGGISNESDPAVDGSFLQLSHSIVAGNQAAASADYRGSVASLGHNLLGDVGPRLLDDADPQTDDSSFEVWGVDAGIEQFEAWATANALGGDLATVKSQAEHALIVSLSNDDRFWSGPNGPWLGAWQPDGQAGKDQGWEWFDGGTIPSEVWPAPWADGQPDNGGQEEINGNLEEALHLYKYVNSSAETMVGWDDIRGYRTPPDYALPPVVSFVVEYGPWQPAFRPHDTDLVGVAPLLGPLADNGGPTWTHALLPGSPAIDAGDNHAAPATDQRHYVRIWDGDGDGAESVDIGAFEFGAATNRLRGAHWTDWNGDGVRDVGDPGRQGWTVQLERIGQFGHLALDDPIQTPTLDPNAAFGGTLAMLGDDILVAAPEAASSGSRNGAVHLFDGDTGAQVRTFANPRPSWSDQFGSAIAVVGGHVLIGAPGESADGQAAGIAYLFDGATGALLGEYHNPTPAAGDNFGSSIVAVGGKVLIGAPGDDSLTTNGGTAYLFDMAGNLLWTYANPAPHVEDQFGTRLAALGDRAVIGTLGNDPAIAGSGVVYLYETSGVHQRLRTFENPTPDAGDGFGHAVAAVGDKVVVTAPHENGGSGIAYVFDVATGELIMTLSDPTPSTGEAFGHSVAASGDDILIGAIGATNSGAAVGSVYLFDGTTSVLLTTFENPTPADEDEFGFAVAAGETRMAVSAMGDDTGLADAGAVYLFDIAREVHATTTGLDGSYSFSGLAPGAYAVAAIGQPAWSPTYPGRVGAESLVNTATANAQRHAAVAADAAGNSVVVWQSNHAGGNDWGVFGQRYDAIGRPVGETFQVNPQPTDDHASPDVAMAPDGAFVVTWNRLGDIWVAEYDAVGVLRNASAISGSVIEHPHPVVAMIAWQHWVVAWQETVGDNAFIVAIRKAGFGAIPFNVTAQTSVRGEPAIAMHPSSGQFVITWSSDGQDGDGRGVFAQRFRTVSNQVYREGPEFQVNTFASGDQTASSVGMDADGDFVVSWHSQGQDGDGNGIYAKRFSAAGIPRTDEFRVHTRTVGDQQSPDVAVAPTGAFVITWTGADQDGSGLDLYAQRFDAAGSRQGSEFRVNATVKGDQTAGDAAADGAGNLVVVWQTGAVGSGDTDIHLQRFTAAGSDRFHTIELTAGAALNGADFGSQPDLAEVTSVLVNDGAVHRSMVKSVTVTFDQLVTIDAGALSVWRRGPGGGQVGVTVSLNEVDRKTVAKLTFSGQYVEGGGSLADGNYELRIDGSKIRSQGNGMDLDGDRDGTPGGQHVFGAREADAFYRMFGDIDGNRNVDFLDFFAFRRTFGKSVGHADYDSRFDWDGNGNVDFVDFYQFRGRFGKRLKFA
ncbi:MAG: hypothetical protein FJ276_02340 [Planctomycetes bacterium]|nr:hypothetical protein [Planctomycetota bacterium]